jgi:hypothetical protein
MAIVFPASPSVNDTFTEGSITYKWDGAKWIGLGITPADRLVEGSNSLEIDSNNLTYDQNGSVKLHVNATGLGVNTQTITGGRLIHAHNTGTGSAYFQSTNSGTGEGSSAGALFGMSGTTCYAPWNYTDGDIVIATNATPAITIKSGGNVGLGTDNPTSDGGTTLEIYNATTPTLKLNDGGDYKALFQLRGNDLEIRGSNGAMEFYTGSADGASSTKKLSITSAGQLIIHHDTNVAPDGYESMLQLADDSYQGSSTVWKRAAGSSAGANPALILQKVRGTDINGQGAVADSDSIGQIRFYGADGTTAIECGNISATVDNTTSTNNVPGKLVFKTAKLLAGQGSPVNPTQAMTIKANHNVEIHDGNLVFETAGTGIDFSANANSAGMSSELLDDYEEGTFTPEIFGLTVSSSYGHYVKVGSLVTCVFYIDIGNKVYIGSGGGTTSLQIILPFNNSNVTSAYAGLSIGNVRNIDFSSGSVKQFAMNIGGNSDRLTGRWIKHNSNFVDVVLGDLYNSFSIHASVTYQAA